MVEPERTRGGLFQGWDPSRAGRGDKTIRSIPRNPLQLAVLVRQIGAWAYPLGLPMPVRKALFAPVVLLAFVGRVLGYRVSYPEYSGPDAKQG